MALISVYHFNFVIPGSEHGMCTSRNNKIVWNHQTIIFHSSDLHLLVAIRHSLASLGLWSQASSRYGSVSEMWSATLGPSGQKWVLYTGLWEFVNHSTTKMYM